MEQYQLVAAKQQVIELHNVARALEQVGFYMAALDVRVVADTLNKDIRERLTIEHCDLINKA